MLTLYDAARCPYCARVRIVLAEKGLGYDTVEVDLEDRPAWLWEKNPRGKVPVLDDDGWLLPESAVIDEYLEERFPEPPLWPADPGERAAGRLLVHRFDDFADAYYGFRRDPARLPELERQLELLDGLLASAPFLTGRDFGLADVSYLPWVLRARDLLGVDLAPYPALAEWAERLAERPSVRAELAVVAAL